MGADYKPGTVAKATVRGVKGVRVMRLNYAAWVTAEILDGSKVHGDSEVTDVRPLVVLDAPQVDLNAAAEILRISGFSAIADQIKAQTKHPRIPEPGLWGVVRDGSGDVYIRDSVVAKYQWSRVGGDGLACKWDEVANPVLVREGVES
jgi:hypothetical protein